MNDLPTVAILCGGRGTRLGDLTKNTPKSLVKVAGREFIFYQLDILKNWGVRRVVLCTGHLAWQIRAAVGTHYQGVTIDYSQDYGTPLGTLSAVRLAHKRGWLGDEFVTLYGDSYLLGSLPLFVEQARNNPWPIVQAAWLGGDYGYTYFRGGAHAHIKAVNQIGDLGTLGLAVRHQMNDRFYQIGDPAGLAEVEALLAPKAWAGARTNEFTFNFITCVSHTVLQLTTGPIERLVDEITLVRERNGRLYILGLGGSAANASHAVNDFRKLCEVDAYTFENLAELTARANDHGWDGCYAQWLAESRIGEKDALLVLSVGGGTESVSVPLVKAVDEAKKHGARVLGIVGRDGGYVAKKADACVIVPTVNPDLVTPICESMQSVILHCLVSHPSLKRQPTKW